MDYPIIVSHGKRPETSGVDRQRSNERTDVGYTCRPQMSIKFERPCAISPGTRPAILEQPVGSPSFCKGALSAIVRPSTSCNIPERLLLCQKLLALFADLALYLEFDLTKLRTNQQLEHVQQTIDIPSLPPDAAVLL